MTLFLHCFSKGHEQLQTIALQIIGDILSAHPSLLLTATSQDEDEEASEHGLQRPLHKMFSKALKSPFPGVQSTACAALSKLMLSAPTATGSSAYTSILNRDELLRLLVTAYFDPDTANNHALRQSLSYFIPVFCHSRKENLECMGRIALPVLHWYSTLKEELDVDGEDEADSEMVSVTVVLAHIADWTDGRKLALAKHGALDADSEAAAAAADGDADVHLQVAQQALEKLLGVASREERKLHLSLLGKLHFSAGSDVEKLKTVSALVDEAVNDRIAADATARNTLLRTQTTLDKLIMALQEEDDAQEEDASRATGDRESTLLASTPAAQDDVDDTQTADVPASRSSSAQDRPSTAPSAAPSEPASPAASPRKKQQTQAQAQGRTPRRRTTTRTKAPETDADNDQENVPPPGSPTKKPAARASRSRRTTAAPVQEAADDENADDTAAAAAAPELAIRLKAQRRSTAVHEDAEEVQEQPAKRPRGRPPRASAAAAASATAATAMAEAKEAKAAPVKRSVRAGRKRTIAEQDED